MAAFGALHLVERGQLALDADVNASLTTWRVPDNRFTRKKKVTLRDLLSHTAGLTLHGFPGYAIPAPLPTLLQILNGNKPANTPALRVNTVPGSQWRYSGGGYTLLQQMILDVTGQPFPSWMQKTVLMPLAMSHSTYEQPLPPEKAPFTATGYSAKGKPMPGRWHTYPEMAAAGLWTTASDLAQFAIHVQQSLAGTSNLVISPTMTRQMLTEQKANDGLGFFLQGSGPTLRFLHQGRNEGFDALLVASAETGQGAVLMLNTNEDFPLMATIVETIAQEYHWSGSPRSAESKPSVDHDPQGTTQIKTLLEQLAEGKVDKERFTAELATLLVTRLGAGGQTALHQLGPVQAVELLERQCVDRNRKDLYRVAYRAVTLRVLCLLDPDNKIAILELQSEGGS